MDQRAHTEMTNRILADLVRSSITNALANDVRTRTKSKRRPKVVMPIGDDLPSYLCTIHRLLNSTEMAAILGWHKETLYRRIKAESFPAIKDKGRWKFDPGKVATWIEERLDRPAQDESGEELEP